MTSRLIITERVHDTFVGAMAERMKALKVDNALKPGTDIGPVVDQTQLDQDMRYIEIAQRNPTPEVASSWPRRLVTRAWIGGSA